VTQMSSELLMQLNCASRPLFRSVSYVSTGSVDLVLTGLELDLASLLANSEVGLLDGAGACIAELLSNVLAVLLTACIDRDETHMFRLRTQMSAFIQVAADHLYPGMMPVQYEMKRFSMKVIKVNHLELAHVSTQDSAATLSSSQGVAGLVLVGILCFNNGIHLLPLSLRRQEAEIISDLCLLQVGTHLDENSLKVENITLAMTYDPFLARKEPSNQSLPTVQWWQEGQQQWSSADMKATYVNQLVVNSVFHSIPIGSMYIVSRYDNDTNVAPTPSSPHPPSGVYPQPTVPPFTPRVPQPPPPPRIGSNNEMFPGPMLEVMIGCVAAAVAFGVGIWWKCRPVARHAHVVAIQERKQKNPAPDPFGSRFDPFSRGEVATVNDESDGLRSAAHISSSNPQDDENFVWEGRGGGGCPPSSRVLATHVPGHVRPKNII